MINLSAHSQSYNSAKDWKMDTLQSLVLTHVNEIASGFDSLHNKDRINALISIPKFYELRNHQPVWVTDSCLSDNTFELLWEIEEADLEGLNPNDYHFDRMYEMFENALDYTLSFEEKLLDLVHLELLLTDAYLVYANHLYEGKVCPDTYDLDWEVECDKRLSFASHLDSAINNNNLTESLELLKPKHYEYARLKIALIRLKEYAPAAEFELLEMETKKIEYGDSTELISKIKKRLAYWNHLNLINELDSNVFDSTMHFAVIDFQDVNGLEADGIVGKNTLEALNNPFDRYAELVKLNMDRWRWLPNKFAADHVKVNIADYKMEVVENNQVVDIYNVIVGKIARKTPVFNDQMTYVEFNPYWTVPKGILGRDVLPSVRKNTNYLAKKNFKVVASDGSFVDPNLIDWQSTTASNFPYRIRQDPGKTNSLGLVKFMFPNKYNVYIHDTPKKSLFKKRERAYSSGCVRVENPEKFATYLMQKMDPTFTVDSVYSIWESGKNTRVVLDKPLDVYILYFTAIANDNGNVFLRNDIYGRDKKLINLFNEPVYGLY